MTDFENEVADRLTTAVHDEQIQAAASSFMLDSMNRKYSYNWFWLGRPIIQYPQDIVAMQEIIFAVKPDLIIETGIAHGGSLIFSASMLELSAICGGPKDARVVGVDIDIRAHNRAAIESHPLSPRITMFQGSSVAPDIVAQITEIAKSAKSVLVCLDSNHTHEHALAELEAYGPMVTSGSYCVVFDTIIERLPKTMFLDRPWGPGDNPMTAVDAYLARHSDFVIDEMIDAKLQISVAPRGYLRRL